MSRRLVLASGSPARLRLLRDAGIDPEVVVSDADETIDDGLDPAVATVILARRKVEAVADRLEVADAEAGPLVLGCDSMLFFDGRTHGKPGTPEAARNAWLERRGRTAELWTGHVLIDSTSSHMIDAAVATRVHFAPVTDTEIDAYVASGEPLAVAGAFTLDGRGAAFIDHIEGDHSNVVGLSLPVLRTMLGELDIPIVELWR